MIQKTTDYNIFKFVDSNRARGVTRSHVERIKESLRKNNKLEKYPIEVNENFEVIDGQHRLTAAMELRLPIYYVQGKEDLYDIIIANCRKSWGTADYLNYYVKKGFEEYIKLDKFCKDNKIGAKMGASLFLKNKQEIHDKFRTGKFIMENEYDNEVVFIAKYTVDYIRKRKGTCSWANTARFWNALAPIINHPRFKLDMWKTNLAKLCDDIEPRVTSAQYRVMLLKVYNYNMKNKIEMGEDFCD